MSTPSKFNNYIKNTGAEIFVKRFIDKRILDRFNTKEKLDKVTFTIEEDNFPASYYVENKLTASFKVVVAYTVVGGKEEKYTYFEIPREIDGVFIIDGSYRVATNALNSDYDCRIKLSGAGEQIINFDYTRRYDVKKKVLKVKYDTYTEGENKLIKTREIKLEDIDSLEGEEKECLRLTEKQSKKFMIKLDLDYKPEYITTKLINECLAYGDDKSKDLIIDKRIDSVASSFMNFIFRAGNGKNYFSARRIIQDSFVKFGKFPDELKPITTQALRFFRGTSESEGDSNLQVPPGINPINLEAIRSKIIIPQTVAINTTMTDLIDFADTPINQNTNKQNSLTVSTHIENEEILFDVYTKDFKKVTIEYLDYLNSKVCASEYVDYDTNTLKPNQNGEVEVKYRMKRKMVKVDEIDLIDLHPDFRLSSTTRQIPFLNSTDSVRISMGTSMLKQSIPLVNAERSLVETGNSEELKRNVMNECYDEDESAKVTSVTDESVIVKTKSGKEIEYPRKTAVQSLNNVCIYTEPKVKVGQTVKKGDVITGAVGNTMDTYKAGINSLVLFHAYHGLVNEDALVVSESYANKMIHYSIIDLEVDIKNLAALSWIAPIGTKIKSGDKIVIYNKIAKLDEANRALLEKFNGIYGSNGQFTNLFTERSLDVPNNIDEGYVSDVKIQLVNNKPAKGQIIDRSFALTSDRVIDAYMKTIDKERKDKIFKNFPEYIAIDKLRNVNTEEKNPAVVYNVRIRIIKKTGLMKGSKVTNRYGGKGVISEVRPDSMMPKMIDKASGKEYTIDVIMNPYSTINRKIAGVLMEQELGLVAHKVHELVEKYKTSETGKKKIMPLVQKYYPRYADTSLDDFLELHNTKPIEEVYYFQVGCFSKYSQGQLDSWLDELGIEAQSDILFPSKDVTDLEELKENLSAEEFDEVVKSMEGKYTKCQKKLQCGWLTLIELYHIPSYSSKTTSSMFGPDLDPKKAEPILGRGIYRATGQKIGEMELSALLSRNAGTFIKNARSSTELEDNQKFLNNLLALGMLLKDEQGYNQGGSSLKKELGTMKAKFRLKGHK